VWFTTRSLAVNNLVFLPFKELGYHVKCPLLKSICIEARVVQKYGQKINHDYLSWQYIKPLFYWRVLDIGKNGQLYIYSVHVDGVIIICSLKGDSNSFNLGPVCMGCFALVLSWTSFISLPGLFT